MTVEAITIADSQSGSAASIAPGLGFNCFSFVAQVNGRPIEALWHDPQFREGTTRPSRSGIPILFPFAGRIRDGRYRYGGREYQLDRNDPQGVNAIHGFVYTRPWRVIEQTAASLTGEFQASLDDPTILSQWPSDFRIRATYTVRGTQLHGRYEFHNPGDQPLPWWFGTHPYFRLSLAGGLPAEALVRFRATKQWNLEQLLPTGSVSDVPDAATLAQGFRVGDRAFDTVFTGLGIDRQNWSGSVTDTAAGITTTIRFSQPFQHCVVFIPPHREAICLEPYSGLPNAFELVERGIEADLQELAPGETCAVEVTIDIQASGLA